MGQGCAGPWQEQPPTPFATTCCPPPAAHAFFKRRWQCSNGECLQTYGRHSNSIDVARKVCGACRAPLAFLGKFKPDGSPAKQRAAGPPGSNKFMEFAKVCV